MSEVDDVVKAIFAIVILLMMGSAFSFISNQINLLATLLFVLVAFIIIAKIMNEVR